MYVVLYSAYGTEGEATFKLEGPYTKQMAELILKYFDDDEYDHAEIMSLEQVEA